MSTRQIYIATPIDHISPLERKMLAERVGQLLEDWLSSDDDVYFPLADYDELKARPSDAIREHALNRLRNADVVLAFQPQHSGGVCFELGFAAALGIETFVYKFADMDDGARLTLMVGEVETIQE